MLYKLPRKSSLMHYMLKLDLCCVWKENLHNSCTGAAMLPSGAHSVHLHGCWSQPLACCSEHSPIVQNTSNFKLYASGCMPETSTPCWGMGRVAHQSITAPRLPRVPFFFLVCFFCLTPVITTSPSFSHLRWRMIRILYHGPFIRD